jgi:hypothetical protein
MPESWDPAVYWDRAKRWREKAASIPEDRPERAVRIELAECYERLAAILEEQRRRLSSRC